MCIITLDSKKTSRTLFLLFLNALTIRVTIKLTLICAFFGNTSLIENGTWKNIKKSMKTGIDRFALLWVVIILDYKTY